MREGDGVPAPDSEQVPKPYDDRFGVEKEDEKYKEVREVVVASISIQLSVHHEELDGGSGLYPVENVVEKPMLLDPCPPRP